MHDEPMRHHFVEIRDASRGHALVTLVEIVSPSNKRRGEDRHAYEKKQSETLESDTSLMEIDLLAPGRTGGCRGRGSSCGRAAAAAARLPGGDQSRLAARRTWNTSSSSVRLEEPLPCIPVPLREGEAEPLLDLQYAFQQAYDGGPYARGAVDYDQPPDVPLCAELSQWRDDCLQRWRQAASG